jgi:hypothetical protein
LFSSRGDEGYGSCLESSRCESNLTLRISAATYDEYCPNAQTIKALRQEEMNR